MTFRHKAATKKGIIVTNLADVVTESTTELTFMIMLTVTRRLIEEVDMLDTKTIKIGIHFYLIDMNFLESS